MPEHHENLCFLNYGIHMQDFQLVHHKSLYSQGFTSLSHHIDQLVVFVACHPARHST